MRFFQRAAGMALGAFCVMLSLKVGAQTVPPQFTSAAYDEARNQVVFFGGRTALAHGWSPLAETWIWDGINFSKRTPVTSPPARSFHSLAYDSKRQQTVLALGDDIGSKTWIWDGTNWSAITPPLSPPNRQRMSIAYDKNRERVVLFGGYDGGNQLLNDTWEWDGLTWLEMLPTNKPAARESHAMAFDEVRGELMMFGGRFQPGTWIWDGTNWVDRAPANSPPLRGFHGMAYDSLRKNVILFGGEAQPGSVFTNDTWRWDGSNWAQLFPTGMPPNRAIENAVFDPHTASVMIVGGADDFTAYNDAWFFDGNAWQEYVPVISVTNTNDSGVGSLRQAIVEANSRPGLDLIAFSIPGPSPFTIRPTSALPDITDSVIIDGYTQPGAATNSLADGTNARLLIELDGSAVTSGSQNGLFLRSTGCVIRGLAINRFGWKGIRVGLVGGGSISGNVIEGNFIGTDITGQFARPNLENGIALEAGDGNVIGGTLPAQRNLISGNQGEGVILVGVSATNQILGNLVGTDATGTNRLGNGGSGIYIQTWGNTVGGLTPNARNVVSANSAGISLLNAGASRNQILGNFVGTDVTGTRALGNTNWGVSVESAANNQIGITNLGGGNLISGNQADGVVISQPSATNNHVQGNLIGLDATGSVGLSNVSSGVLISESPDSQIGPGNIISGNGTGITLNGGNCTRTRILGNWVGLDGTGRVAVGNKVDGITITGGSYGHQVGGSLPGEGNVVSGNAGSGIHDLGGGNPGGSTYQGNYIGTDATGTNALGNAVVGLWLSSTPRNLVGGLTPGARNVISANATGFQCEGTTTRSNSFIGNYVGTDATGTKALGNLANGIWVLSGSSNVFGGPTPNHRNIVAANRGDGVALVGSQSVSNLVQGNWIGLNALGSVLGNGLSGGAENLGLRVGSSSAFNVVASNVISGNVEGGVSLDNGAHDNRVEGNLIGTAPSGVAAAANGAKGIIVQSDANRNLIVANLVSGNSGPGILFGGSTNTSNNRVEGNRIGPDLSGVNSLGNTGPGVRINTGNTNSVGGTTEEAANLIAFNTGDGVEITSGSGHAVRGNQVFSNGGLGIDLLGASGVGLNDVGDADTGANQLQNFPVITNVAAGTPTVIAGMLNSAPNAAFILDFYASAVVDATGYGEGQRYLGSQTVTTDAGGNSEFSANLAATSPGEWATATATDSSGNTSEFSKAVQLGVFNPGSVALSSSNLVVLRVGDGLQTLTTSGNSAFLDRFTTAGELLNTVAIPDGGSNAVVMSGSSFVEGYLTRSLDGSRLCFAAYGTNVGSGINVTTSTNVPRAVVTFDAASTYDPAVVTKYDYAGVNFRSAATDGTNNFWGAGSTGGTVYLGNNAPHAVVQNSKPNDRVVQVFNGSLFMASASSAGDGLTGIYRFSGLPRTTVGLPAPMVFTNTFNTNTFAGINDFAINPAGTIVYFADDRDLTPLEGGIQRWDFNPGQNVWINSYHLTNGLGASWVSHLEVDWSGPNPVLYATTKESSQNRLIKVTDAGPDSLINVLAVAGTNQIFRGVKFGPVTAAPFVATQPQNRTNLAGTSATFTLAAGGTGPFNYQWRYNGVDVTNSLRISGAQSPTLTLANVQTNDIGNYTCVITGALGSVPTSDAWLAVVDGVVPPAGLVDWWPAEDNANDLTGPHNGVPVGAVTYVSGKAGRAFHFDGATTRINLGALSIPPPWTASFWVNRQNTPMNSAALLGDANYSLKLEQFNGTHQVGISRFGVADDSFGYVAPAGTWVHLVFVGTGTNTLLYTNGVLRSSLPVSIPLPRSYLGADLVRDSVDADHLLGELDEVALFNRVLSNAEIAALYLAGNTGQFLAPLPAAPGIVVQPEDRSVSPGGNTVFAVGPSGTPPLTYQWQFNNANLVNSAHIAGAQTAALTILNVLSNDAGNYRVIVSNALGSATSRQAALTVTPAPGYNASLLAYEGFNYTAGTDLSGQSGGYGWSNSWTTGIVGDTVISNANSSSLNYTDALGNTLLTSGNTFFYSAASLASGDSRTFRDLPVTRGADNTTTWIAFLGRRSGPTTNLTSNPYPRGATPISLYSGGTEKLGIGNSSGVASNTWSLIPAGATANLRASASSFSNLSLVVVRIDHKPGNDDAYLFINPVLDSEPQPAQAAAQSLGAFDFSFNRIRPFVGANDAANGRPYAELLTDEIRIGNTFASVTPFQPSGTNAANYVYSQDFQSTVGTEWSTNTIGTTPKGGRKFLGEFGNQTVSLALASLPTHTLMRVSFDLFVLRTWDGSSTSVGPDVFRLARNDGVQLFRSTFNNHYAAALGIRSADTVAAGQCFPGTFVNVANSPRFESQSGAAEINTLGYFWTGTAPSPVPQDAVYQMSRVAAHTASTATLNFSASGLEALANESWGLANVRVELFNLPSGSLQNLAFLAPVPPLLPGYPLVAETELIARFTNNVTLEISHVGGVTYTSSNTNVFTVNTVGEVSARNPGIATLVAAYQGLSATTSVTVLSPVALRQSGPATVFAGSAVTISLFADFPGVTNQNVTGYGSITRQTSDSSVATFGTGGLATIRKPGNVTLTSIYGGLTNQFVLAVELPPGFQAGQLVNRYSFSGAANTTTVADSVGGADGTVVNLTLGSTNSNFTGAGELRLAGGTGGAITGAYVNLPNGLISGRASVTFEGWVTWRGTNSIWQRIFDFGRNQATNANEEFAEDQFNATGASYLMLTPRASATGNPLRLSGKQGTGSEPALDAAAALPLGVETHFAAVYDPPSGLARLYVNGQRVASGAAFLPLNQVEDLNNWLGRSQWSGDAFFAGSFNEFRIYDGALLDDEVLASYAAGPDNFAGVIARPANDEFINAVDLSGPISKTVAVGANVGAAKESGEPDHAGNAGGKSVWWNWLAPTNGSVMINTLGSSFDTLLAVYVGSTPSTLSAVSSNDNFSGSASQVTFAAVAGERYRIAVDGKAGLSGRIVLNLAAAIPPPVSVDPPGRTVAASYDAIFKAVIASTNNRVPAQNFYPVDFSSQANFTWTTQPETDPGGATGVYFPGGPSGQIALGGIPFDIKSNPSGRQAWNAHVAAGRGAGSQSITINVGQYGVSDVYTLINTFWSLSGPNSAAWLIFTGSGGATYTNYLIGGSDIRDWCCGGQINGSSTVEVYSTPVPSEIGPTIARLDMQHIVLPPSFTTQTLASIQLVDDGGPGIQRVILDGVTVTTPFAYQWYNGNTPIAGAVGALLTISNVQAYNTMTGHVTVTGLYGTGTSTDVKLIVVPPYSINTFAGLAGSAGSANGTTAARFNQPHDLTVDATGNVYVVEMGNDVVRKITPSGNVSTLAGLAGNPGLVDGSGSAARFNNPWGVCLDTNGNLFVADAFNHSIRRITPGGVVTTFAGTLGVSGSADGTGAAARFNWPRDIVIDPSGNLFVADFSNHTIRMITPAGVVTTIAGRAGFAGNMDGTGTSALFNNPSTLALDPMGNLFVAEELNHTIRKMTRVGTNWIVSLFAGQPALAGLKDGIGTAAHFNSPSGLAADALGNLYVAEPNSCVLRKITPDGVVTTLAGLAGVPGGTDGVGRLARATTLRGIATDAAGTIYLADFGNHTIRKATPSAGISIVQAPVSQAQSEEGDVELVAQAVGRGPFLYQWFFNGNALAGATNATLRFHPLTLAQSGQYQVRIRTLDGLEEVFSNPVSLEARKKSWQFSGTPGLATGITLGEVWARRTNEAYVLGWKRRSVKSDIPDTFLYRWNGSNWTSQTTFPGHYAGRILGTSSNELWLTLSRCALGPQAGCGGDRGGKIYRSLDGGTNWIEQVLPLEATNREFRTLSGTVGNIQVVADGGLILRFDGSAWSTVFTDPTESVNAHLLLSATEGYYVTCWGWGWWDGNAWTFNGRQFDFCDVTATWALRDPAGGLHWYAVGANNYADGIRVWKFDPLSQSFGGRTNQVFGDGSAPDTGAATGVWGSSPADVYVIGSLAETPGGPRTGRIYHYDGSAWSRVTEFGEIPPPTGIHGTAHDDVWIALQDGRLLRRNSRVGTNDPPVIITPPADQAVVINRTASFAVAAQGTPPLRYQWRFEGTNVLLGATNPVLPLPLIQLSNAGLYSVTITNAFGAVTSAPVNLLVIIPPSFDAQPASTNVTVGGSVTLSVLVSGAAEYQWRKNGANIEGATNASFTISNVQFNDGGSYTVVVANDAGAVTSDRAEVIVLPPEPPAAADYFSNRLSLSLVLTGGPPVVVSGFNTNATKETPDEPLHAGRIGGRSVWYTWTAPASGIARFNTYGSTFDSVLAVYTGEVLNKLTEIAANDDDDSNESSLATNRFFASEVRFNAQAGTNYAIALDGFGGEGGYFVLLGELEVTPQTLPEITTQPQSQVERLGTNVSFSITATGANLRFQWYFNGLPLAGATNASLALTNIGATHVGTYSVRASDPNTGRYLDSQHALLEISSDPEQGIVLQDKVDRLVRTAAAPRPQQTQGRVVTTSQGDYAGNFYSVAAGTVGYHLGNNVQGRTDLGEVNHAGLIGNASLYLSFETTNAGTLVVDTKGSGIDNLFAVYRDNANYDQLGNGLLGFATNSASATNFNSIAVTNGAEGGQFLVVADGVKGRRGTLQINWSFGTAPVARPNTNAASIQKVNAGDSLTLRLNDAAVTNAAPRPFYRWYRDDQFLAETTVPYLLLSQAGLTNSGTYRVVAQNELGITTNVLARLLINQPLSLLPGSAKYQGGVFSFALNGTEGDSVVVQATTNLARWQDLSLERLTGYERTFQDAQAGKMPGRFYRVVREGSYSHVAGSLAVAGAGMVPGAGYRLTLPPSIEVPIVIEASSNLQTWVPLRTNPLNAATTTFTDPAGTNNPVRFYRLRLTR